MKLEWHVKRQRNLCEYCKNSMEKHGPFRATKDHVTPRSKGGQQIGNIVAACMWCNSRKGDLSAVEFMKLLPTIIHERNMDRSQRKALKRQRKLALDFSEHPNSRKQTLRASEADLRYAAKATSWAEHLAVLIAQGEK